LGSLRMPDHLRAELSSEAFGILLRGNPVENALKAKELIATQKPPKVIVVGDFTLKALLDAGCVPDLGIFDRLTKRIPFDFPNFKAEAVRNPAGEISDEAVFLIKKALNNRRRKNVMLVVDGEEDLLSLPAIANAPMGSFVIYGLPERGMMLVTADRETKEKIASVIRQFQRKD
jgi:uncharacterized protein (UPF0218 family)